MELACTVHLVIYIIVLHTDVSKDCSNGIEDGNGLHKGKRWEEYVQSCTKELMCCDAGAAMRCRTPKKIELFLVRRGRLWARCAQKHYDKRCCIASCCFNNASLVTPASFGFLIAKVSPVFRREARTSTQQHPTSVVS